MTIEQEHSRDRRFADPKVWSGLGEQWSMDWGGSAGCWRYSIEPRLRPHGNVLEIGCGRGQWSRFIGRYHGVDLNEECLEIARRGNGTYSTTIPDRNFDRVFSWNSLCYSPASTLELITRLPSVVSDGGFALLHVGDILDQAVHAAISVGMSVSIAERIDYPTGAANCWLLRIVRGDHPMTTILHSTLRAEIEIAKRHAVFA